jgi:homoserine kinase
MALLIAGLADSRLLIGEATEDRLHQDYRSPLFPAAPKLLAGMTASGALAVCWSGAGPSLLGICKGTETQRVRDGAESALAEAGVPGEVLVLHPDLHGLILDRQGSGEVYDFNTGG